MEREIFVCQLEKPAHCEHRVVATGGIICRGPLIVLEPCAYQLKCKIVYPDKNEKVNK